MSDFKMCLFCLQSSQHLRMMTSSLVDEVDSCFELEVLRALGEPVDWVLASEGYVASSVT